MGTLKERLERAVADKGLSIGDAWNLLGEALEHIERLEADARRYRFLRSAMGGDYFACIEDNGENGDVLKHEADLDAAIDARLSAKRGGE